MSLCQWSSSANSYIIMWDMWTLNNQCPLKDQCKQIPSQIQTNTLSYTNIKQTYFPNNKEVFVSETPWATPATTGRCTTGTNLSTTSGTGTSEVADFFYDFVWSFRHFNILGLLQLPPNHQFSNEKLRNRWRTAGLCLCLLEWVHANAQKRE